MARIGELRSRRSTAFGCCVAASIAVQALAMGIANSTSNKQRLPPAKGAFVQAMHTRILNAGIGAPAISQPVWPSTGHAELIHDKLAGRLADATPLPTSSAVPTLETDLTAADSTKDSGGVDEYLPRELLTRAPSASIPVLLSFPDDMPDDQILSIVLRLYVDEFGVVRRVKRDSSGSLESALAMAEQAFRQARFNPGEVNGHPVKSIIDVEVTFDSTSLDTAH